MNKMVPSGFVLLGLLLVGLGVWMLHQRTQKPAILSAHESPGLPFHKELKLPSHEELLDLLGSEAMNKGVYYQVWCTAFYEGDKEEFSAIATVGKPFNMYIEEGAGNYWSVQNFPTEDEATYALLQALKSAPNTQPMHKENRKRASCPEPLSGGPITITKSHGEE